MTEKLGYKKIRTRKEWIREKKIWKYILCPEFKSYRESLRLLLALNFTLFFEGMVIIAPVRGFLPFFPFVILTSKLPNPEKVTLSSDLREPLIPSIELLKAFSA